MRCPLTSTASPSPQGWSTAPATAMRSTLAAPSRSPRATSTAASRARCGRSAPTPSTGPASPPTPCPHPLHLHPLTDGCACSVCALAGAQAHARRQLRGACRARLRRRDPLLLRATPLQGRRPRLPAQAQARPTAECSGADRSGKGVGRAPVPGSEEEGVQGRTRWRGWGRRGLGGDGRGEGCSRNAMP
eukprot:926966-Pleurochrysis_carterae.AAC.2